MYKLTSWVCIPILLAGLGLVPCLQAQITPDTAFQVTNTDRHWLTYYTIVNEFDSACVSIDYGEVLLRTATSKVRVKPKTLGYSSTWYNNPDSVGLQAGIANLARWDSVTVPENSEVRFYRLNGVKAYTTKTEANPTGRVTYWRIHDRSIFVLEARDFYTDTLVCRLDSVSLDTCTKTSYAGYSGTNPTATYHSVTMPSHAIGKKVYFVVKPYRFGPTPYGMSFETSQAPFVQSLVHLNSTLWNSKAEIDKLDSMRFSRFLTHLDSYYKAYCYIPDYSGFGFSDSQFDTIIARYWILDTVHNGKNYYRVRPCDSADSCSMNKRRLSQSNAAVGITPETRTDNAVTIVKHIVTSTSVQLLVNNTTFSRNVNVSLFQPDGRVVGTAQGFRLMKGENEISVVFSGVASGAMFIRIADERGAILATLPILK